MCCNGNCWPRGLYPVRLLVDDRCRARLPVLLDREHAMSGSFSVSGRGAALAGFMRSGGGDDGDS